MPASCTSVAYITFFFLLCRFGKADGFSNTRPTQVSLRSGPRIHPRSPTNNQRWARNDQSSKRRHTRSDSEDQNANGKKQHRPAWHPERLLVSFIRSFLKGLTIPFPQLREILQRQGGNKKVTIGLGLRECVAFLVSYMAVGVLAFSFVFEKWSLVDSLYFTAVCFSTVGYGDLCPTTAAGRIFTCCFGVAGIAFLGAAVATISTTFVQAEVEAVKKVETAGQKQILKLFRDMPKSVSKFRKSSSTKQKELLTKAKKLRKQKKKRRLKLVTEAGSGSKCLSNILEVLPPLSIILGGGAVMGYLNSGWSLLESAYYSIITASTIGLGDFTPITPRARMFAIFYIPLSVGAAGDLLSGIATSLLKRRQKRAYLSQFEGKLTLEHLRAMDTDGDGGVSREEYCFFMLKEMGLVTQEDLDELSHQFDALDVSRSGAIDKEDLELMAKLRGAEILE